jgi:hypothetical protein
MDRGKGIGGETPKEALRSCSAGVAIISRKGQVRVPSANGWRDGIVEHSAEHSHTHGQQRVRWGVQRVEQGSPSELRLLSHPGEMGAVFPLMAVASEVESELSGPSRRPQEKYSGDMTEEVPSLSPIPSTHVTVH